MPPFRELLIPVFLSLGMVLAACERGDGDLERHSLPRDEHFLALGTKTEILLGAAASSPHDVEVAWQGGSTTCRASQDVIGLWWQLRELLLNGDGPEQRKSLSLDPNRYVEGQTIALARGTEEEGFRIWYVESPKRLRAAAEILSSMLDQCGADVTFELYPNLVY